jgi:UDP-N-acetylmuramoyl-L-alanyl-D-glutamate--2,6-diaminopimelate ligase
VKTLKELLTPSEILSSTVNLETKISEVIQDSRLAKPSSLFVAIKGSQSDGHQFLEEVWKKGAIAVVESIPQESKLGQWVQVVSTRALLGRMASRFWGNPTELMGLVGVTGTNGKTTTTFLLDQIWQSMGLTTGLIGTVENRIANEVLASNLTTPGAIELQQLFHRMVQRRVEVCAMEVSSIALDQERTQGSSFKVGVFTNFTQDHLDYHKTMECYFESKVKLFKEYSISNVVVNIDDPKSASILSAASDARKISFSFHQSQASFHPLECDFKKTGTTAKIQTPQGIKNIRSPLIGSHNLMNLLGALGVVEALNQDLDVAIKALETAGGAPGRLERAILGNYYPNVFVDYAHSEDALENVLKALQLLRGNSEGKIITVFGCGGDRDRTKRPKMARVASQYSEITIATSDNPRTENPESILDEIEPGIDQSRTVYYREVDRRAAIYLALKLSRPEDIVLIAGKGHENYQIIGTQKQDFDDRQVVRDYYSL